MIVSASGQVALSPEALADLADARDLYLAPADMVEKAGDWDESEHPRDDRGRFGEGAGGIDPEIDIETDDIEVAVRALAEGRTVALSQPRQVSTLLDRLAQTVEEAKARGEQAPSYDLCNVTVKGTNLFCAGGKDIPRLKMPQLYGKPVPGSPADALPKDKWGEVDIGPAFLKHLSAHGLEVESATEDPAYLRATQSELNGAKVAALAKVMDADPDSTLRTVPLFVSRDNYIVDGHHRWAAVVAADYRSDTDAKLTIPVRRVKMDIIPLLARAHKFASDYGLPVVGFKRKSADPGLPMFEAIARRAARLVIEIQASAPRVAEETPAPPAPRRVRKTVLRDENNRIKEVIEEDI
jgi:hypothetical protein